MYNQEQIQKANQFLTNLQSFTNREISEINDDKPCNDKTRQPIIMELIANEFGDNIFKHLKVKYQ